MTVGTKLHQTLSNLEAAAANLQSFSLETQDQSARKMYNDMNQQLEKMCQQLKGRVNYIEQEEPQYKMEQQQQQQ